MRVQSVLTASYCLNSSLANLSPGVSSTTAQLTGSSTSPIPSTASSTKGSAASSTTTVPARFIPTAQSREIDAPPSLGTLVGDSGDLGSGGTSTGATIAIPVARSTRMTRLAMANLPEADRRSVQQELDAAWRLTKHSTKKVKTAEPSSKRQKT